MIRGLRGTRRRGQPQWLIALVAALYVLALATVGLHDSIHAHRVCEHGELVHVDGHAGAANDHGERSDTKGPHAGDARPNSTSNGDHAHEHCTIALPIAREQRAALRLVACIIEPAQTKAELRETPRVPSSEPLFLLAPHHSPPAV